MAGDPRSITAQGADDGIERVPGKTCAGLRAGPEPRKILLQMHCHHRAIFNMKDEVAVLSAAGGAM